METLFSNIPSGQLENKIAEEERNYYEALRKDEPFFMLKEIKNKIKTLRSQFTRLTLLQEPFRNNLAD